jgi:hypothetical protein
MQGMLLLLLCAVLLLRVGPIADAHRLGCQEVILAHPGLLCTGPTAM